MDFDFYNDAFVYREFRVLRGLIFTLRRLVRGEGRKPYDAWNACLDQVVILGKAYVERITLEKFVERVKSFEEPGVRNLMAKLCNLYALSRMDAGMGWFLTHGYF